MSLLLRENVRQSYPPLPSRFSPKRGGSEYTYDSPQEQLVRASLSPSITFPRVFLAATSTSLVCPGCRRGSARSARTRPVRGLGMGISAKMLP